MCVCARACVFSCALRELAKFLHRVHVRQHASVVRVLKCLSRSESKHNFIPHTAYAYPGGWGGWKGYFLFLNLCIFLRGEEEENTAREKVKSRDIWDAIIS